MHQDKNKAILILLGIQAYSDINMPKIYLKVFKILYSQRYLDLVIRHKENGIRKISGRIFLLNYEWILAINMGICLKMANLGVK